VRAIISKLGFGPMLKGVEMIGLYKECSIKEIMGDETA
jgi:hypothetical protein